MLSRLASPLFLAALSSAAVAQTQCGSATHAAMTNWSTSIPLPAFDPELGSLQAVRLQLDGLASGTVAAENLNVGTDVITWQFRAELGVQLPDLTNVAVVWPGDTGSVPLAAYDGVTDFMGPSGFSLSVSTPVDSTSVTLTSPAELAQFVGPPGNPGTVGLPTRGVGQSTASGSGNLVSMILTDARASLQVCYDYLPHSVAFCPGDGSAAPCPCGNVSAVGADEGCLHSFGAGARLRGGGVPSLSADTYVLDGTQMPNASALYFQGTQRQSGGLGVTFGDGLRCAGGTILRLGTRTNAAGASSYPGPADPPVSQRGQVGAPGTRTYQVWYRNAAPFCTPSSFNLSNGLEVTWIP